MRLPSLALASTLALGIGLSAMPASAQSAAPVQKQAKATKLVKDRLTHFYKLGVESTFTQGCFDPCACPIWQTPDFRGTFELHSLPTLDPIFNSFEVRNVNWLVASGDSEIRIVGSGIYRVAPGLGQHQLQLDLVLNDGAPTAFDSGLIAGGGSGPLPKIDIDVSINGLVCYDTLLSIKAAPQRRSKLIPYRVDSGFFQEGCLPPCLCPISQPQPVTGRFLLLPLGQGPNAYTEFAVLDVQFAIHPPQPSPLPAFTPVSGQGIYGIQLITAAPIANHRMLLELDVGGASDNWDSGPMIDTGPFPIIDISLGINDFFCFERIFSFEASPY